MCKFGDKSTNGQEKTISLGTSKGSVLELDHGKKNSKRIVLYRKEIYMVLLSSLRLANNLEGSTSLFEAGQASVEAIFIECNVNLFQTMQLL